MADPSTPLRIIPLGGVGEIGKNMYCFEYGDDIVVIDCGLMFPDEEMFGIDLVVPDVTYLKENRHKVRAFLITHAHEDHVGGLPYVLPEFPGVPVYASTLARGLLGNKIKEHKLHNNPLLELEPGDELPLGPFTAVPFRIGHSIPDAMGIALRTPVGIVVHTGDFKFDHTPVDGKLSDFHILARLGEEGVICLLSDSTRAENPGYTPSERTVGEAFREIMEPLDGRVIVATFASNIARIQQVLDAAAEMDRKVAVIGRSMEQNFRIATDLGYLKYDPSSIVAKDKIKDIADGKLVIATTGAQGEPMAGLARMANRDHRFVEIQPGDTVIVSASPIPGNEEYVARTIDNLFKAGANVYYHTIKRAHVSGHASQEELKLMLGLTKPTLLHPDARRVPDAGPARPPRDRDRRQARQRVHHRERHAHRDLAPTAPRAAASPVAGRLRLRRRAVGRRGRRRRPARPAGARQRRHVHDRRPGGQADRARSSAGPRSSPAASSTATRRTRSSRRRSAASARPSTSRATGSARSRCSRRRSRTGCPASCTSRPSAARWCSRSWSRSSGWRRVDAPPPPAPRRAAARRRRSRRARPRRRELSLGCRRRSCGR